MKRWIVILLSIMLAGLIAGCTVYHPDHPGDSGVGDAGDTGTGGTGNSAGAGYKPETFMNFSSEEEVREYIQSTQQSYYLGWFGGLRGVIAGDVTLDVVPTAEVSTPPSPVSTPLPVPTPTPVPTPSGNIPEKAERFSGTNVQVAGIDEPDIIKTDGENIYLSKYWKYPIFWEGKPDSDRDTKVIKAFPPESLEVEFEIDETGDLLLYNNTLIIFSYDQITAYNVSEKPEKVWKIDLSSNLLTARLYQGKIYLITRSWIDVYEPSPIKPLTYKNNPLVIEYRDIYHPIHPIPVDTSYNIMILNPETGDIEDSISFLGSSGSSVVYMSTNAIYITYFRSGDQVKLMYDFLKENRDLVSEEVIKKIEKLNNYDISNRAKLVEIQIILDQYSSSLDKDERKKFENEFWNRLQDYREEHKRELEKTEIVKISMDLKPIADGEVPGRLLNQFSLDEYEGYLRVATTIRDTNDVYILDKDLKIAGSIKDFGKDERIYAVRFLGDKGYVVTFRQTDPFFIMDLSNPEKPEIKGELKIPGYSSYLHPISENIILGIGKEDQYVKISLFDVSSPDNPREIDKYTLKEYWSDILRTHHAFLIDQKHEVFFLPGSDGGYIFSYKDKLELIKAVDMPAIRAVFIDDYLYIIGEKIVVFDENTWEKMNEINL